MASFCILFWGQDCKEIQSVHPKGNQSWIFIGRTDTEAETPVLWPPDAKNRLIGKDPDAGKEWRQKQKGMTEDEMLGWYHWRDGHELSKLQELVMDREAWRAAVYGVTKSQIGLSDWTELNWIIFLPQIMCIQIPASIKVATALIFLISELRKVALKKPILSFDISLLSSYFISRLVLL